jgi:hypothetical protein
MTKNTSCPICRGEIHAIAGRCKHCKADLVDLRERAARIARAQALGATVPPPPRAFGYFAAAPGPRAGTLPPEPPPPDAMPPPPPSDPAPGPADASNHSNHADHATTLVNPPGEPPPYAAADYAASMQGGQQPYVLGFAGGRSHRASTWSRRWPLVVSAVALLAIGISIGVLAERWRQGERRAAHSRQGQVSRSPAMVPDRMPQPLLPGPHSQRATPDPHGSPSPPPPPTTSPSPSPDDSTGDPNTGEPDSPDTDPDTDDPDGDSTSGPRIHAIPIPGPDPSNPGSRFSRPPSPHSPLSGDATAFRSFTSTLTESLCQKLTQCGLIDSATQSMCRVFAQELDQEDAAEKVARGECSFNQRAADACLRAVADLRCDMGSSDRMWDWLMAPNRVGECAEAYVCQ